jgi:hypothetical protein
LSFFEGKRNFLLFGHRLPKIVCNNCSKFACAFQKLKWIIFLFFFLKSFWCLVSELMVNKDMSELSRFVTRKKAVKNGKMFCKNCLFTFPKFLVSLLYPRTGLNFFLCSYFTRKICLTTVDKMDEFIVVLPFLFL